MKTKAINYPKSRFVWADIEKMRKDKGVDDVWMCRENQSDALAVLIGGEVILCKGSIVAVFDGSASSKFLLHRRSCEELKRIDCCICHDECVFESFEWAAVVVTAKAGARADAWFKCTPESISGNGVVEVAEDAFDNPYKDYPLVDEHGPFD